MNDETRKLFDAPWITDGCEIHDSDGLLISSSDCIADANRLSHLPELYDALLEAAYEHCHYCVELESENEYVPPSSDFIKYGCPKKSQSCFCRRWWDVLRKVEAGE